MTKYSGNPKSRKIILEGLPQTKLDHSAWKLQIFLMMSIGSCGQIINYNATKMYGGV